jgi:hypothetical protein
MSYTDFDKIGDQIKVIEEYTKLQQKVEASW